MIRISPRRPPPDGQRRDYDLAQRTDASPPRHAPPTRSLAEWRTLERDWLAAERSER